MAGEKPDDRAASSFALDVDEDLMSAALEAVARHARPRRPPPPDVGQNDATDPVEIFTPPPDLLWIDEEEDLEEPGELDLELDTSEFGKVDLEDAEETSPPEPREASDGLEDEELEEEEGEPDASDTEVEDVERTALVERVLALEESSERQLGERNAARAALTTARGQLEEEKRERRRALGAVRRLEERIARVEEQKEQARTSREQALVQLEETRAKVERLRGDLQRHRERSRKEQEEARRRGHARVIDETLPVLDNLEIAVRHAEADPGRVIEGVRMIVKQFQAALGRVGVTQVPASAGSPFDPEQHEAILQATHPEIPSGHLVEEVSSGWRLEGRLLRAARVTVSTGPAAAPSEPATEAEAAPAEDQTAQPDAGSAAIDAAPDERPPVDDNPSPPADDPPQQG